ncbi:MAG: EF-P lysine aminoacylase GenX [Planctomycetales bacterium]|nr:EF-P lysine aminoacylase GenX [Planctomycetales bacterium]
MDLLERLRHRAALLQRTRRFFDARGFIEVDTPVLDAEVIPELHIEPIATESSGHGTELGWLQASPELGMKRLMTRGGAAIYQICKAFRAGERGRLHRTEFTMVEWYRAGDDYRAGIDLLKALTRELLSVSDVEEIAYRDALMRFANVDPWTASDGELSRLAGALSGVDASPGEEFDRDDWLNVILAIAVEPKLGSERPVVLTDYPATQAALAVTAARDVSNAPGGATQVEVAERFELYFRGVELANGYHELADGEQLRLRLECVNVQRAAMGLRRLPMPQGLLRDMATLGLPACAGCALGFDRAAMLAAGGDSLADVEGLNAGEGID